MNARAILARLEANLAIDPASGCLLWTGSVNHGSTPQLRVLGATWQPHRLAWTLTRGPIPDGHDLGRTCRNRLCVNLWHAELVSTEELARRRDLDHLEANTEVMPDGCWRWLGTIGHDGYGQWGRHRAHRRAYRLLVGEIPAGWDLHHSCLRTDCVNPGHCTPVSPAEHGSLPRRRRRCCPNGHPYTPTTTATHPNGSRRCLVCKPLKVPATASARHSETHCNRGHTKTPETFRTYVYDYGVRGVCLVCARERYYAQKGSVATEVAA